MLEAKNMDGKTTSKEGCNIALTSRSKNLIKQTDHSYKVVKLNGLQILTYLKL